jgi:hypothetical protein
MICALYICPLRTLRLWRRVTPTLKSTQDRDLADSREAHPKRAKEPMTTTGSASDWRAYLSLDDATLFAQCRFDRFRASGPGGQKRNVTDSAVRLRHTPSGLTGEANESRSQHENRARALRRLRLELALRLRAPVDLETYAPPPELAEACRGRVGRRDGRYLTAIAQAFDLLEASGWRVSDAAALVGVTTSALTRLVTGDPIVLRAANERRQALAVRPLRPS